MIPSKNLDAHDLKILRELTRDGRISWRDLADNIGLSLTPTLRRVRRLEKQGYIEGYTATLDETRLLGSLSVFISITLERQSENAFAQFEAKISKVPEVLSCFLMTGGSDYLLRVVVREMENFQQFINDLSRIPGVAHIQSSFAIRPVVRKVSLAL